MTQILLTELEIEALDAIVRGVCDFGNLHKNELNEETIKLTEAAEPYGSCWRGDEKVFRGLATSLSNKGLISIQPDEDDTWIQLLPPALAFVNRS